MKLMVTFSLLLADTVAALVLNFVHRAGAMGCPVCSYEWLSFKL